MIEGVVLAAGRSTRTGEDLKMTLPLDGATLVERAVDGMAPFVAHVFVVTGWRREEVEALFHGRVDVTCVFNEKFDEGMFSSLKAGLAKVRADAAFVLPGDCPFAAPAVYEALLESDAPVTVPSHLGRTGHPVLLRREAFPLLLNSPDTSSLRDFISGIGPRIVDVDDPGILRDIDTMEDYDKAYGK